jgi:uncharacterized protein YegL
MTASEPETEEGTEEDAGGLDEGIVNETAQHTPTALILDTSSSMKRTPDGETKPKIDQLNEGLQHFKDELMDKASASSRVDVGVVTFGGTAEVQQEMTHITEWEPPELEGSGGTPMGAAINKAIEITEGAKNEYRQNGTPYTQPLLWLLTDGKPTDMDIGDNQWEDVTNQIEVGEAENHLTFFAMGVGGADMEKLNALVDGADRPALKLEQGKFDEYFEFISNSLENVSEEEGTPDQIGDPDEVKDITAEEQFVQK